MTVFLWALVGVPSRFMARKRGAAHVIAILLVIIIILLVLIFLSLNI